MDFYQYKEFLIEDIIKLINIKSVYDEMTITDKLPFGEGIDACLDATLLLCEKLGFKTYKEPNGYYGYAEVGFGDEYIALLCHLDVVPEGDLKKWKSPPFEGTLINNEIFGRGASDDKGPTVATIYAVKALIDSKIDFKKRIRIIFGIDEETLWRGMEVYVCKEKNPICAIAPDGVFPFAFAEKGLLQIELTRKTLPNDIIINGGKNFNSVAMDAYYEGDLAKEIACKIKDGMEYTLNDNGIKVIGVPAHAATPYAGKNAVLYLAKVLKELGEKNDIIYILTDILNYHYQDTKLFDELIEDESGVITVNLGAIEMNNDITKLKVDIRIPVTYSDDYILNLINVKLKKYDFSINVFSYLKPIFAPLNSEFSKILLNTYQKYTNDYESKPISIGGGTYARVFSKNSVCFGPKFKNDLNTAHEPNEKVNVDSLMKALEIYYHTLIKLNECETLEILP